MAKLDLTLYGVKTISTQTTAKDIFVSTEKDSAIVSFSVGTGTNQFQMDLIDLSFHKKMYQPTEVIATIQIGMIEGEDRLWLPVPKENLENAFKNKKVSLKSGTDIIGDDYFVHEVLVDYRQIKMIVTLKIYSLDKLLTQEKTCRTFVSKKLGGEILKNEIKEYKKPYAVSNGESETVEFAVDNMKILKYDTGAKDTNNKAIYSEHIHPYLVQYNESLYDMLARTANRWGEFLYYEDGKLHLGYTGTTANLINYRSLHYFDLSSETIEVPKDRAYDYVGSDEKSFGNNLLKESPNEVSGTLFYPNGKGDKVAMNYMASIFKNDKNIPTFLSNKLYDDTYDILCKAFSVGYKNEQFNGKYFPLSDKPGVTAQYGTHDFGTEDEPDKKDAFNQFTEIHSRYDSSKYLTVFAKEQAVCKNAVSIDFDTTYPKLKLGNIITVNGKKYIIVEVSTKKEITAYKIVKDQNNQDVVEPNYSLVFQVKATAKNTVEDYVQAVDEKGNPVTEEIDEIDKKGNVVKDKDGKPKKKKVPVMEYRCVDTLFYPAVLPSGHVRYSDPQIATVTDADDPLGCNRVRVKFSWEVIEIKEEKIQDSTKKASSPWLTFTTNASGSPAVGLHYEGDKLLIGFVGGNIERPYVLGGLATKGSDADVVQTTPGGHTLKLNDDKGGIVKFVNGMFWPGWNTLSTIFPQMSEIDLSNVENNQALGGGFELSDNYGIYKISGSTDKRNITVASPWGDVSINAFTGITISAPNGDVTIKGKNVKIEAGNNLELTSGTNVKNKIWGDGGLGGFFEDAAAAATKKFLESVSKTFNLVNLSIVRSFIEIAIRPAEGKLLVKSNRYLMLESGKGACDYPAAAYKDDNSIQKAFMEHAKKNLMQSVDPALNESVCEIIQIVNRISNEVDKLYRERYNTCCDKLREYNQVINNGLADARRIADDYGASTCPSPKIMKEYSELDTIFWAKPPYEVLKAEQIFMNNFKVDSIASSIANQRPIPAGKTLDYVKETIAGERKVFIDEVMDAANELRVAICNFLNYKEKVMGLSAKASPMLCKNPYMPNAFKNALANVWKNENFKDLIYFQPVTTSQKDLTQKYSDDDALQDDRKVLKRKAAAMMLEEIGFKDDWRKKIDDPNWAPDPQNPLAIAPKVIEVPRNFTSDNLKGNYWNHYVDSIECVPKLKLDSTKMGDAAVKVFDDFVDTYAQITKLGENKTWNGPDNGSILFSFNHKVYDLKKDITNVDVVRRNNLQATDDPTNGEQVITNFLNSIKKEMKKLN